LLAIFRRSALRVAPDQRKFLLLYGVSLTLMNISWTLSVALNGAAVSTVMVYASPGITAIAARFFFKERLSPIRVLAFLGALLGAFFVKGNDPASGTSTRRASSSAYCRPLACFYSLMGKPFRTFINSWTATLSAFSVATIAVTHHHHLARANPPPVGARRAKLSHRHAGAAG
jgi:drug/metabolite transporter (DMT)-like permease